MQVEIVKPERLYLKVADQIASQIKQGQIARGDRLPSERDLADMFGVSRPTIREAMIALEITGMVDIRSGSGVYIKAVGNPMSILSDAPGPLELLEARLYVESDAAGLAAQRSTSEDLREMQGYLEAIEDENKRDISHEQADENFHLAIARASGNSAMFAMIKHLWTLRKTTEISKFLHSKMRNRGIKPVIEEHRVLFEAIARGDAEAARSASFSHLQNVIDGVVNAD